MGRHDMIFLGKLEKGFATAEGSKGEFPENILRRDLWNAFNTCMNEGNLSPGYGPYNEWVLRTEDICIEVHESSRRPGACHGLSITDPPAEGSHVWTVNPINLDWRLQNGILVLWNRTLTVSHLRGAIL